MCACLCALLYTHTNIHTYMHTYMAFIREIYRLWSEWSNNDSSRGRAEALVLSCSVHETGRLSSPVCCWSPSVVLGSCQVSVYIGILQKALTPVRECLRHRMDGLASESEGKQAKGWVFPSQMIQPIKTLHRCAQTKSNWQPRLAIAPPQCLPSPCCPSCPHPFSHLIQSSLNQPQLSYSSSSGG